MKPLTRTVFLGFSVLTMMIAVNPLLSYAEEERLSQQEFARICAENHAEESRRLHPPLKDPELDPFNYEFHYREVLLSSDGKSFVDNPHDMKGYRSLAGGQIIMDMEDGYEMSYEYHITDMEKDGAEKCIVEGKTITPYYRAIPSGSDSDSDQQYAYVSNDPDELPVIPDFPKDYDWKKHKETTLQVCSYVTVRSLHDGSTYDYYSRMSMITNLYKDMPDCYFLTPTDLMGYTVQEGDTLQKIAQRYCGSSTDWIYILERNRDCIQNADMIYPDMFIVIPNAESLK